jgi:quercetin dioxygenase-like cupin family protein
MYAKTAGTTMCAIIDHGKAEGEAGLQALERDGLWVTHRQGQHLQVLTGRAWVTFDGADFVLRKGDRLTLASGSDPAVVSALGAGLTILELC